MTAMQREVISMIPQIPDEKLYEVLTLLRNMNRSASGAKTRKRRPGLAEGEIFLADGYDMDAEDPEITEMFEGM